MHVRVTRATPQCTMYDIIVHRPNPGPEAYSVADELLPIYHFPELLPLTEKVTGHHEYSLCTFWCLL